VADISEVLDDTPAWSHWIPGSISLVAADDSQSLANSSSGTGGRAGTANGLVALYAKPVPCKPVAEVVPTSLDNSDSYPLGDSDAVLAGTTGGVGAAPLDDSYLDPLDESSAFFASTTGRGAGAAPLDDSYLDPLDERSGTAAIFPSIKLDNSDSRECPSAAGSKATTRWDGPTDAGRTGGPLDSSSLDTSDFLGIAFGLEGSVLSWPTTDVPPAGVGGCEM
jgi:hypothetical protein